jgi:hypothetical protein
MFLIRHVCFSLAHPWIKEDGEAPDTPLDNAVLTRLKQFRAMNKFKKVALRVYIIIYIHYFPINLKYIIVFNL